MKLKIDKPLLLSLYKNGVPQIRLAKMFDVSRSRISIIISKEFSKENKFEITRKSKMEREINKVKAKYENISHT